jgi:hypothetical protein
MELEHLFNFPLQWDLFVFPEFIIRVARAVFDAFR